VAGSGVELEAWPGLLVSRLVPRLIPRFVPRFVPRFASRFVSRLIPRPGLGRDGRRPAHRRGVPELARLVPGVGPRGGRRPRRRAPALELVAGNAVPSGKGLLRSGQAAGPGILPGGVRRPAVRRPPRTPCAAVPRIASRIPCHLSLASRACADGRDKPRRPICHFPPMLPAGTRPWPELPHAGAAPARDSGHSGPARSSGSGPDDARVA
jgi:hypothetical protein